MAQLPRRKVQFYYDPETCTYHPVETRKRDIFRKVSLILSAALVISLSTLFVLNQYYPLPKEQKLANQQSELIYKWNLLDQELSVLNKKLESLWVNDEEIRRILELDSLPVEVRSAGIGGIALSPESLDEKILLERKIIDAYKELESFKAKLEVHAASLDTLTQYANERDLFWASIPAIQPVENKDLRRLSTVFGMRLHPIIGKYMPHKGFDFMGNIGVPIYATGNGRVKTSRMTYGGFGNLVEIDHGYGYVTRYAHLSSFAVQEGQEIKRGELIGFMGNSGRSAGPHLHYEVLKDGVQVNPIGFFERGMSEEAYARLLKQSKLPSLPLD